MNNNGKPVDPNAETVRMAPIRRILSREVFRAEAMIALADKTAQDLPPELRTILYHALNTKHNDAQRKLSQLDKLEAEEKTRTTPDSLVSVIAKDFFANVA